MLRSDLCNYSDAYFVVKETKGQKKMIKQKKMFKNNVPFKSFISKIHNTLIDNEEDLDIVMSIYNLLEYSKNYSILSGNLWNYYRDEIEDINDNLSDGKSFKYKTKIVGNAPAISGNEGDENWPPVPSLNVDVTIPLKHLSNF